MNDLYITVLAGGIGKRMKSQLPKVLHQVNNIPMIVRILYEVKQLNPVKIIIVVGQYKDIIKNTIDKYITDINFVYSIQNEPLGTGNAVLSTLNNLDNNFSTNLILNGDTPMLKYNTLKNIYNNFIKNKYDLQITAIQATDPIGCGRIILDNTNKFTKIIEEKDCNDEEKKINLINCGIYISKINLLKKLIPEIKNNNFQKEYYLTDLVELCIHNKNKIGLFIMNADQENEIININTKEQLDKLNQNI